LGLKELVTETLGKTPSQVVAESSYCVGSGDLDMAAVELTDSELRREPRQVVTHQALP
jgi:hypothetical protein